MATALTVAACQTVAPPAHAPALLSEPDAACHAELEKTIGAALGAPVTLQENAFRKVSYLSLERRQARDEMGRLRDGLSLDKPELFTLVRGGNECLIGRASSPERTRLHSCSCVPNP